MPTYYFHKTINGRVTLDQSGIVLQDEREACAHAVRCTPVALRRTSNPRADRPPNGLRDSLVRSAVSGCPVARWAENESGDSAGAGADVLRGGVLCTRSASVILNYPSVVEVRAGAKVQTSLRPVFMPAWFHGKEDHASKEKAGAADHRQRDADCCSNATRASRRTR